MFVLIKQSLYKRQGQVQPQLTLQDLFACFPTSSSGSGNPGGPLLAFCDIDTAHALFFVARFTRRAVHDCTWSHWFNAPRVHIDNWRDMFPHAQTVNMLSREPCVITSLVGCTRVALGGRFRLLNRSRTALTANLSTIEELALNDVHDLPRLLSHLVLHDHNGDRAARRLRRLTLSFPAPLDVMAQLAPLALTHLRMPADGYTRFDRFAELALLPTAPRILAAGTHQLGPLGPLGAPVRTFVPAFASLEHLSLDVAVIMTNGLTHLRALPALRTLTLTANSMYIEYNAGTATLPLTELTLINYGFRYPMLTTNLLADLEARAPFTQQLRLRLINCGITGAPLAALYALHAKGLIQLSVEM